MHVSRQDVARAWLSSGRESAGIGRVSGDGPRGGASNVWAELDVDGELRVADRLTEHDLDGVVSKLCAQTVDVSGVRHVDREGQREAGMVVDLADARVTPVMSPTSSSTALVRAPAWSFV